MGLSEGKDIKIIALVLQAYYRLAIFHRQAINPLITGIQPQNRKYQNH
jgi:hypothetical protein